MVNHLKPICVLATTFYCILVIIILYEIQLECFQSIYKIFSKKRTFNISSYLTLSKMQSVQFILETVLTNIIITEN